MHVKHYDGIYVTDTRVCGDCSIRVCRSLAVLALWLGALKLCRDSLAYILYHWESDL